jgi:hypothetical protein
MATPKLKKIKTAQKWTTAKNVAKKEMSAWVKKWTKEFKGDKEELDDIKQQEKNFKDLYSKFKSGLSPKLKAVENAKAADEQIKLAEEALVIIKAYSKQVDKYAGKLGDPQKTQSTLYGMLNQLEKDLKAVIAFAKKLA